MLSLRDRVKPGVSRRYDFPLVGSRAALLIIDIQLYLSSPASPEDGQTKAFFYQESLPPAVQNIRKLAQAFRVVRDDPEAVSKTGCEVIFTYLQAATNDGRDISLDYKLSGPALSNIPRVGVPPHEIFLKECQPDQINGKGDILLPKTSCSVFQSTNLDYMLRNLGVEQLVVVGQLTDQCVESAVRDGADLGYFVTVAEDACAAESADAHLKGLQGMKGFCRILQTAQIMDEIVEDLANGLLDSKNERQSAEEEIGDHKEILTDEKVLEYLKSKNMEDAAEQLSKQFEQKSKVEET